MKIVRPRIFVLLVRAERAYISWRFMNKTVSNHLIFPFEPFPAKPSMTARNGAEVRTVLRVYIRMGAVGSSAQDSPYSTIK